VLLALYFLGGEAIAGFSLALIIGVVVGTYSTIYIATAIAIWLGISKADLMPSWSCFPPSGPMSTEQQSSARG
jgi:preprotein translocase subunit SecF